MPVVAASQMCYRVPSSSITSSSSVATTAAASLARLCAAIHRRMPAPPPIPRQQSPALPPAVAKPHAAPPSRPAPAAARVLRVRAAPDGSGPVTRLRRTCATAAASRPRRASSSARPRGLYGTVLPRHPSLGTPSRARPYSPSARGLYGTGCLKRAAWARCEGRRQRIRAR